MRKYIKNKGTELDIDQRIDQFEAKVEAFKAIYGTSITMLEADYTHGRD
jgi:hypothetical protein